MKTIITKNSIILQYNSFNKEIIFEKILNTKTKKYHGKNYWAYGSSNRAKSWITKLMDKLFFINKEEIEKLPKEVKNKLSQYIADRLYYPKYTNNIKNWIS